MSKWFDIEEAPQDGSPVWARGHEWGVSSNPHHVGWVYWSDEGDCWMWAGSGMGQATYLTEYQPR